MNEIKLSLHLGTNKANIDISVLQQLSIVFRFASEDIRFWMWAQQFMWEINIEKDARE